MHFNNVNDFFEYIKTYTFVDKMNKKYVFWYDSANVQIISNNTTKFLREVFDELKVNELYSFSLNESNIFLTKSNNIYTLVPNMAIVLMILDYHITNSFFSISDHELVDKLLTDKITFNTNIINSNGKIKECILTYEQNGDKSISMPQWFINNKIVKINKK